MLTFMAMTILGVIMRMIGSITIQVAAPIVMSCKSGYRIGGRRKIPRGSKRLKIMWDIGMSGILLPMFLHCSSGWTVVGIRCQRSSR